MKRAAYHHATPFVLQGRGPELSNDCTNGKLLDAAGLKIYQTIMRSLQYQAQVTRYDIAYTVNQLSGAL